MKAVAPLLFVCALAVGCATTSVNPLTQRAMFDLQCPRENLRYVKIDDRSYGVIGCDKRATYIQSCQGQGWNEECTWVLNGTVDATQRAPSSGPPGQN
jgi:hypothetical protein